MYDVIVVGARVAGASTAMLLARRGLKVLCIDKTTFPSDTLSTHQIQLPGVAKLKQWGLLDRVAANTPPTREVRFDTGEVVLEGGFPLFEGVDAIYGPRRIFLDKILVDAARASGVELREDVVVEGLVSADGRVTGVRGRSAGGAPVVERTTDAAHGEVSVAWPSFLPDGRRFLYIAGRPGLGIRELRVAEILGRGGAIERDAAPERPAVQARIFLVRELRAAARPAHRCRVLGHASS